MRRRSTLLVVLATWLLATGVQWDMVQVVGWGRMLASYSQTMRLSEALKKTFSGEMCSVCDAVQTAKQVESKTTLPGTLKAKLVIVHEATPTFFWIAPESPRWRRVDLDPPRLARNEPDTPPPRA